MIGIFMLYLNNMENGIERVFSINEALQELYNLLQQMESMGAQDYERDEMNNIIKLTQSGKLLPNEAVRRGRAVFNAKQDYH